MSTITPADLRRQIESFEIEPELTECLARVRHGIVARRLWPDDERWREVVWLHPRDVWRSGGGAVPAGSREERPPLDHLPGPHPERWILDSVATLERDIKRVDPDQSLTASHRLAADSRATVEQAFTILRRIWPEAARECHLLVRAIVYLDCQTFRSATQEDAFGAVYAGRDSLTSVPAAFEMLLHETGHHSLYLRTFFDRLAANGRHLASHPMRPDPRPISGVLHASHVLARMATGLGRWAAEPGAPRETVERADQAAERLSQSLEVLEREAEWTEGGARYFATLRAAAGRLRSGGPVRTAAWAGARPIPAG